MTSGKTINYSRALQYVCILRSSFYVNKSVRDCMSVFVFLFSKSKLCSSNMTRGKLLV